MRRPRTTFSKAVVAIAISAATGIQAQQPTTTAGVAPNAKATGSVRGFSFSTRDRSKATKPTAVPDSGSSMMTSRGARQLLRNGEDYLSYGQYDRALDFLREAENKQFELTAAERTKLNADILRAKRGLRGVDDGTVVASKGRAPARGPIGSASTANRPGAIVLSVPRSAGPLVDDPSTIQLTSATQEEPAPAEPAMARRPAAVAGNPGPADTLPPLPPAESVAPAESPEPLSAPGEFAAPASLSDAPAPVVAPPDLPAGPIADERPAPPALSTNAEPTPVAEAPLSDPLPNIAPVELAQPAETPPAEASLPPVELPPAAAPVADVPPPLLAAEPVAEAPLSDPLPNTAPVELAQPAATATAETPPAPDMPPPILLEEEEVPAPEPAPVAAEPAQPAARGVEAAPTDLPPLVLEEPPAPADAAAEPAAPADELTLPENAEPPVASQAIPEPVVETPMAEPVVRTAQTEAVPEPAPAPAPVAEEAIAPPPAAEASTIDLPPLPAESPTASQPPAISLDGVKEDSLRDRATSALSEHKRPALSEDAKRRIEQIARRQQDDSARNPVPPLSASFNNAGTTTDDIAGNRLELPRAPSPTEIRPIRAIPIPEEFVPLVPRQWTPSRKAWTAAATCHGPLYFQDAVLERYGQSVEHAMGTKGRFFSYPLDDPRESNQRNQILQPFYSIGLFASQVALLPYNLVVDPPWEAEYDLGYYRPGDRVPPDTTYLPLQGVGPPLRGRHY